MAPEPAIDFGSLLAHDVPLEWHEAVAVVREVCAKLFGEHAAAPDPSRILLHQTGMIELLTKSDGGEPVAQRLGHTLNALLQGTAPPAELRLVAAQAIAGTGAVTIDEFSQRLAYFERPGRSHILQLLYERAAIALAAAQARRELPLSATHAAIGSAARNSSARSVALKRTAFAAVTIASVFALTAWAWPRLRVGYRQSAAATVVAKTHSVVGSLIASGISSGRDLLTKAGVLDVSRAPAAVETDVHPAPGGRSPRSHTEEKHASSTQSSKTIPTPHDTDPTSDGPAPAAVLSATPAGLPTVLSDVSAPDSTIYSAEDADVVPPELVWPQLSGSSHSDAAEPAPTRGEVDLLVNETGVVERVKFLNKPERLRQSMLLSAMKAWQYHPALKDGHPVKYVVRVALPF